MNIFWLDTDLEKCAQYHCDKHTVKMLVEYVQLLSASSRLAGVDQGYRLSHIHHPCVKWLLQSRMNWLALYYLAHNVYKEYHYRYYNDHKSYYVLCDLKVPPLPNVDPTPPPQCMPDKYKCDDFIKAYRNYYIGEKAGFAVWSKRDVPSWFNYDGILIE